MDTFAFTTALGGGVDRIAIDDAVFTGLAQGRIASGAFRTGPAAQDADDRPICETTTGGLLFGADAASATAAVQFAALRSGLGLGAADFFGYLSKGLGEHDRFGAGHGLDRARAPRRILLLIDTN